MKNLLTRWLASFLSLLVITQTQLIPGIHAKDVSVAVITTIALGLGQCVHSPDHYVFCLAYQLPDIRTAGLFHQCGTVFSCRQDSSRLCCRELYFGTAGFTGDGRAVRLVQFPSER